MCMNMCINMYTCAVHVVCMLCALIKKSQNCRKAVITSVFTNCRTQLLCTNAIVNFCMYYHNYQHCQAQPKPQPQLGAKLVLISNNPATHPTNHPSTHPTTRHTRKVASRPRVTLTSKAKLLVSRVRP